MRSIIGAMGLINQIYFPREIIVIAALCEALVDALQRGDRPAPTRGAPLTDWRDTELQLAGFFGEPQQLREAVDAPSAALETLAGNRLAEEKGWQAPAMPDNPPPLPAVADKK